MKFLDITGITINGMWSYGVPLPPVQIDPIATIESTGWSGHSLHLHTLSGTYIETADHVFPNREKISEVSVNRFVQTAYVAHLSPKRPLEPITADELASVTTNFGDLRGHALLVSTGWEHHWNDAGFVSECPYFTPEAMDWVLLQDVSLLGVDIPCVQDPRDDDGSLVRKFFDQDRLLLAPIINLEQTEIHAYQLVALPLKIPGVCGTPCRAILMEME